MSLPATVTVPGFVGCVNRTWWPFYILPIETQIGAMRELNQTPMPIANDPLFKWPRARAKVWRYMDFSKLTSLLATKTLFFPRADRLQDEWEGAVPQNDVSACGEMVAGSGEPQEDRATLIKNYPGAFSGFRRHTYVSCWHLNEGESAAMWRLYLKSDEGIALQTSFGCLRKELNQSERRIHIGKVRYLNYKKGSIPGVLPDEIGPERMVAPFAPFIFKRLGFSHEKEVRCVFQDSYNHSDDPSESECGLGIEVNVGELVKGIYVAPGTPAWLRDTVQSILDKFGIDRIVTSSEFDAPPAC